MFSGCGNICSGLHVNSKKEERAVGIPGRRVQEFVVDGTLGPNPLSAAGVVRGKQRHGAGELIRTGPPPGGPRRHLPDQLWAECCCHHSDATMFPWERDLAEARYIHAPWFIPVHNLFYYGSSAHEAGRGESPVFTFLACESASNPTFFPLLVIFFFGARGAGAYFFRQVPSDHFGGGDELAPAPDWRKQMTQEPVGCSRSQSGAFTNGAADELTAARGSSANHWKRCQATRRSSVTAIRRVWCQDYSGVFSHRGAKPTAPFNFDFI